MTIRRKLIIVGAAALALAASGTGVAVAVGGGEADHAVTGAAADGAKAAALRATGGGTAKTVERDNGAYDVQVKKPDGTTVDVRLDERLGVTAIESNSEASGGDDAAEPPPVPSPANGAGAKK